MAVSITAQMRVDVSNLYVALFGRAPDGEGLGFWTNLLANGTSLVSVANTMYATAPARTYYPSFATNQEIVASFYLKVLGRPADAEGLAFWTAKLNAPTATPGSVISEMIAVVTNYTGTDPAGLLSATLFANKANVALYYGLTNGTVAGALVALNGVDATTASVTAAKAAIDGSVVVNPGQAFTLTAGADTFVGTTGNDVINALTIKADGTAATTLTAFDSIDGGAGTDTLNIFSDGISNTAALAANVTVKNVETVNINNTGAGFGAVDASKFVGATAINQAGVASAVTNLAAGTVAGFNGLTATALAVTAATAATTASVSLGAAKGVATTNVATLAIDGAALTGVTVTGTLAETTPIAVAKGAVQEVQTIDFTGTTRTDGNITVGGVTVAVLAADSVGVTAGKVQAAINAATLTAPASTGAVVATVLNNVVTVTFPATAGNPTAIVVANGTSTITGTAAVGETVSGSIAVAAVLAANLALNVTIAKDAQTATVNTAVASTLTVANAAGSTKSVTTVDASASAGAITYTTADNKVATIKSGAGADTLTISTLTSNTVGAVVNALLESGAGNDKITISTTGTGTTTVNAGDGADTITLTGTLNTATRIDGGAGVDTITLAGKTLIAEDIVLFNNAIINVENVAFTGATVAVVDASKLAFTAYTFAGNVGDKVTEASAAALTTKANLDAFSTGYKADTADADLLTDAQGGNLNITQTGSGAIKAFGSAVALTVTAGTAAVASTLTGDAQTATVTLTNAGNATIGDTVASLNLTVAAATVAGTTATVAGNSFLTSLTLSGNGSAVVVGGEKLATINASALGGTVAFGANKGNVTDGLTFTGAALVESITLGSGKDNITVTSTYAAMDTIMGFDAVKETNALTSTTDVLVFGGATLNGTAAAQATKLTLTANATTLDLAFVEAAAADAVAGAVTFFQFGGNTYLFQDAGAETLEAADLAVKVVGLVDFSAAWGNFVA